MVRTAANPSMFGSGVKKVWFITPKGGLELGNRNKFPDVEGWLRRRHEYYELFIFFGLAVGPFNEPDEPEFIEL
jgi:hypothetical protein